MKAVIFAGLDYLTEFQTRERGTEPTYTCDLCASKMDPRQVISHVTGVRHRRKFMVQFNFFSTLIRKYLHFVLQFTSRGLYVGP